MTTKKETALVKVEGGKSTQEMTVHTAPTAETVTRREPEQPEKSEAQKVEELKKQVEALQKKLLSIPENLDARIKYFNEKKELIRRLSIFNSNIEALETHAQKLHEIAAQNDFENEDYFLTVEGKSGSYKATQVLTLKNPVMICKVIEFIIEKMDLKRLEIAAQIEA